MEEDGERLQRLQRRGDEASTPQSHFEEEGASVGEWIHHTPTESRTTTTPVLSDQGRRIITVLNLLIDFNLIIYLEYL